MGHVARQERPAPAAMTSLPPAALGLAGLATASTAITLAVSNPLIGRQGSASYNLALSGVFCAGVAEVGAAVWWTTNYPGGCGRVAAGAMRKLLYASLVPLAAAGDLAVATLFWF